MGVEGCSLKDAIQANEETEIREKANTQITTRNLNTKGGFTQETELERTGE